MSIALTQLTMTCERFVDCKPVPTAVDNYSTEAPDDLAPPAPIFTFQPFDPEPLASFGTNDFFLFVGGVDDFPLV